MARFGELGMKTVANSHTVLRRGDAAPVLAGVTDIRGAQTSGLPGPDVAAAFAGAPQGAPIFLLDHQPRLAAGAAKVGVSLELSGHTHGGLIAGFDRFIPLFIGGFVAGRYELSAMGLYVSNGTALWPGFAIVSASHRN